MKSLNDITDKVIAVPYDFDFSGFVGTNYSFPQEWATTCENITDREYLGYCRDNEENYLKTIALYNDKKEKEYLLDFINEFYSEINEPRRFINTLKNQCRNDEF